MVDPRLVDGKSTFSSFSHILDSRILRALADMGFARPTLVQLKAIPIALENRDILARARTGSGKTAAYCIPVLQKILKAKAVRPVCKVPDVWLRWSPAWPSEPVNCRFLISSHPSIDPRTYPRALRASTLLLAESLSIL